MLDLKEYLKGREGIVTALNAMCDGLETQSKRNNFVVDMSTFGTTRPSKNHGGKVVCYGCAATCTIQELAKVTLNTHSVECRSDRQRVTGILEDQIYDFEHAIDEARTGELRALYGFCGVRPVGVETIGDWFMDGDDWRSEIPLVRQHIRKLMDKWDLGWTYSA